MSILLYPTAQKAPAVQKRLMYLNTLTDIARASEDAIEALSLFQDLLVNGDNPSDVLGFVAFDAHGGDTGCHLRAGMLKEFFDFQVQCYRTSDGHVESPAWLASEISNLKAVNEAAKNAAFQLSFKKAKPQDLGLDDKQDAPLNILASLDWKEPVHVSTLPPPKAEPGESISGAPSYVNLNDVSRELECFAASHVPSESGCSDTASTGEVTESTTAITTPSLSVSGAFKEPSMNDESIPEVSIAEASKREDSIAQDSIPKPTPKTPSEHIESVNSAQLHANPFPFCTTWDTTSTSTMLRFLVHSYTLSKYKSFVTQRDSLGARLVPEAVESRGVTLMTPFVNRDNQTYSKKIALQRFRDEFKQLQKRLTDLSCAWQLALAESLSPEGVDLKKLITDSAQTSVTGLTAIACWPSFLVLRQSWARMAEPVILVNRHFCSHGE